MLVTLNKEKKGYGLNIAGPLNEEERFGIFVSGITDSSPAGKCKRILIGDEIVVANGIDFKCLKHSEAVAKLRNSGETLVLKIRRGSTERCEQRRAKFHSDKTFSEFQVHSPSISDSPVHLEKHVETNFVVDVEIHIPRKGNFW